MRMVDILLSYVFSTNPIPMMKIEKYNDRVVYLGEICEKLHWGYVQFPKLYPMQNGNIGLYIHDDDDSWVSIGKDNAGKWLVTEDEGKSWRRATKEDVAMMGTVLPNGDVIRPRPHGSVSLKGVKAAPGRFGNYHIPSDSLRPQKSTDKNQLPNPFTVYGNAFEELHRVYWLDTMPDGLVEKRFGFHYLKNGETESRILYSEVDWNHRTIVDFKPTHAAR